MTTETNIRSHLQNRVDPWGKLHVRMELGTWLGNRGILHDEHKQIIKPWDNVNWKSCLLKDGENTRKGATSREKLFTEGNYSELFFLDEATAFSAGHRPCAQCRNKRYKEFKSAWAAANRDRISSDDPPYQEMDNELQRDRVIGANKKTYEATFGSLPDGTIIDLKGVVYLIWRRRLYKWSFAGYEEDKTKRALDTTVDVLTPSSIVRMYADGFVPQVHVSAFW